MRSREAKLEARKRGAASRNVKLDDIVLKTPGRRTPKLARRLSSLQSPLNRTPSHSVRRTPARTKSPVDNLSQHEVLSPIVVPNTSNISQRERNLKSPLIRRTLDKPVSIKRQTLRKISSQTSTLQDSPLQDSPLQDSPLQDSPLQGSPLQDSPFPPHNTEIPSKKDNANREPLSAQNTPRKSPRLLRKSPAAKISKPTKSSGSTKSSGLTRAKKIVKRKRGKSLEIKLTRLNNTSNHQVLAVDIVSQIVSEFILNSELEQVNQEVLNSFHHLVGQHFNKIIDTNLSNNNLLNQVSKANGEKKELRQKIYNVRKDHSQLLEEIETVRMEFRQKKEKHQLLSTVEEELTRLKQQVPQDNATEDPFDELELKLADLSKVINPQCGIMQKLKTLNTRLSMLDEKLS